MATTVELDPIFRQALRYLHSSQTDAAENIRKSLDDVIKQKHGSSKMLINTLSKKHIAEESKATGSGVIISTRRSSHKSSDSSSNNSPVQIITTTNITTPTTTVLTTDLSGQTQEIPVIISLPDSANGTTITAVDDNAMDTNIHNSLFEDLACVVCRRIDFVAKNRLIECTKCNSLYHQECHSPQIKDSDLDKEQEAAWMCTDCKGGSSAGTSVCSSSSSSSSKKEKERENKQEKEKEKEKEEKHSSSSSNKSKSSSSRHRSSHHSSSSSHHSSRHERSSGSGSDKGSSKSSSSAP